MKKVKLTKYFNHPLMTGGKQYVPDEVAEFKDDLARYLVNTNHAVYIDEPKKPAKKKPPKIPYKIVEIEEG